MSRKRLEEGIYDLLTTRGLLEAVRESGLEAEFAELELVSTRDG